MGYWLIKSEPYVYSYDDLEREGKSMWEGVRNYQARNNLRAMELGDLALFYHSNKGVEVVGIAQVVKTHYPDPTAEKGDWSVVEFAPVMRLKDSVTLKTIKATEALSHIPLVTNSRLSVQPIDMDAFQLILSMGNTTL